MLWGERGEGLWNTRDGGVNKACADRHGVAEESMGVRGPAMRSGSSPLASRSIAAAHQHLPRKRPEGRALEWESDEQPALTTYIKYQSRGMLVQMDISGAIQAWRERGQKRMLLLDGGDT